MKIENRPKSEKFYCYDPEKSNTGLTRYSKAQDKYIDYLEAKFNNGVLADVRLSLPPKYCDQCGEPVGRKHTFWCKDIKGNEA